MPTLYFTEMESPLGTLCLVGTARGLTGLFMEEHRHGPSAPARHGWVRDAAPFAAACTELAEYLARQRTEFTLPLDRAALGGTPFQRRVWAALEAIPYGVTISYQELATRLGDPRATRAVGLANGRNPLSIIVPCHRVIGARGQLTGYGGGLQRKHWLLAHERAGLLL